MLVLNQRQVGQSAKLIHILIHSRNLTYQIQDTYVENYRIQDKTPGTVMTATINSIKKLALNIYLFDCIIKMWI